MFVLYKEKVHAVTHQILTFLRLRVIFYMGVIKEVSAMSMIEKLFPSIKRVLPDSVILAVLVAVLLTGFYQFLPAPMQVLISKVLLVSAGFVHAHITRKIAFPKVDWNDPDDDVMKKLLIIALYVIFIYAYAQGG